MHKISGQRKRQDLERGWQHRNKPLSPSHLSPHQLQQKIGNRAVTNLLQAKLTVGQPNDRYEQEADRTAAAIMRMPSPPDHDLEDDEATLQTALQLQAHGSAIQVPDGFEAQLAHHQASGQPLPTSTRDFMEPRFGADFSHVRIHQTPALAEAIHAKAFTHGNHIYFNAGQYNPGTHSGKVLLAHELTHVMQQTGTTRTSKSPILSSKDSVIQRQEADTPSQPDSLQVEELDKSVVDPVMGIGFYQKWLTSMEKAAEVEKEARSIAQLLPEKSTALVFLANELGVAWGSALLALNKAIGIGEKRADIVRRSAINEAINSYSDLVVISTDLEKINAKSRFLLEAKVFDFLHGYGVSRIKQARKLKAKLDFIARELGILQKRIADAPQDVQDSLKQLGLNVAIFIAMGSLPIATIPLSTAIYAYSAAQAIKFDELWGPDTPELNTFLSNSAALGNSSSGLAKQLLDGRANLQKVANSLGNVTAGLGFFLDLWEVGIAAKNYSEMYSLFNTLKALNQNYASLYREYRELEPLLANYELSIRIINGLKQAAGDARKQAHSM